MKYKYIPNSYNNNLIGDKYGSEDSFVKTQVAYRKGFENLLRKSVNFDKIDSMIESKIKVPTVDDKDYNFYHKFSTLGSNYLYLRNNFHVENLTEEEIFNLYQEDVNDSFFKDTYQKVVFEDGDSTFFGVPMDEYSAKSKSLVFEFAYDQTQLLSIDELKQTESVIKEVFEYISDELKDKIDCDISFITYNSIPDLYRSNNDNFRKHVK